MTRREFIKLSAVLALTGASAACSAGRAPSVGADANILVAYFSATGKTVIPFCTSSSSGIGQSGELLAEMAGTGDWRQGRRFSSGVSESDVRSWLNGMGL